MIPQFQRTCVQEESIFKKQNIQNFQDVLSNRKSKKIAHFD